MAAMMIPEDVMEELRRRAAQRGVKPQTLAVEILRKGLLPKRRRRPRPKTERGRVIEALHKSGLVRPVDRALIQKYVQPMSPADREVLRYRLTQRTFRPTLSEMVIQDRGL